MLIAGGCSKSYLILSPGPVAADMLANPGGYSIAVDPAKIIQYDPEDLVIAPCAFKPRRSVKEMNKLPGCKDGINLPL